MGQETTETTINTSEAQGATGLLGESGPIELNDIMIECGNSPAGVLVISLDGKPLKTSGNVLVQAVVASTLTGSKRTPVPPGTTVRLPPARGKGKATDQVLPNGVKKIEASGHLPFQIERVRASITFKSRGFAKATALDMYGYRRSIAVKIETADEEFHVDLPADGYYTILER